MIFQLNFLHTITADFYFCIFLASFFYIFPLLKFFYFLCYPFFFWSFHHSLNRRLNVFSLQNKIFFFTTSFNTVCFFSVLLSSFSSKFTSTLLSTSSRFARRRLIFHNLICRTHIIWQFFFLSFYLQETPFYINALFAIDGYLLFDLCKHPRYVWAIFPNMFYRIWQLS